MKNDFLKKFSSFYVNDTELKTTYGGIDGGGDATYCDNCGTLELCSAPKTCQQDQNGCVDTTRTKSVCKDSSAF